MFQSLWSRAGSFDQTVLSKFHKFNSFNPFGAGQGLSTLRLCVNLADVMSFNPFGAGQGLSTAGVVWCLGG